MIKQTSGFDANLELIAAMLLRLNPWFAARIWMGLRCGMAGQTSERFNQQLVHGTDQEVPSLKTAKVLQ